MLLSAVIPNAAGITVAGKSATSADTGIQAQASEQGDIKPVISRPVGLGDGATAKADSQSSDSTSVTVKLLLQRLKELQQQLREQQQQLAQVQAASYPTAEAKAAAVAGVQGQVAQTTGAILEVSASLVQELSKGSSTGSVVNTTA
jgi:hypothetical protein